MNCVNRRANMEGGVSNVTKDAADVSSVAAVVARHILATNEGREDRLVFADVPSYSRVRLPCSTDRERAVASAVIAGLRSHDTHRRLNVTRNDGEVLIEGPYSVFEDAHQAARGRA